MFNVFWNRFEHGNEDDAMITNSRSFDTYEKAKKFLLGRFKLISSVYWAGGYVENENGEWILDITYTGDMEEKRNIKGRIL